MWLKADIYPWNDWLVRVHRSFVNIVLVESGSPQHATLTQCLLTCLLRARCPPCMTGDQTTKTPRAASGDEPSRSSAPTWPRIVMQTALNWGSYVDTQLAIRKVGANLQEKHCLQNGEWSESAPVGELFTTRSATCRPSPLTAAANEPEPKSKHPKVGKY